MDRRTFSKSIAGGLALTASCLSLNTLAAVLGVEDKVSECYSCDGFKQLMGQRLKLTGGPVGQLELSGIEAASKAHPDTQFYLLFRQSEGLRLNEGIYQLASSGGKSLTLLLNPSSTRPELMEAVVNLKAFA
jgi:hypothetical protein